MKRTWIQRHTPLRPVRRKPRRNRNGIPLLRESAPFRVTKDGREICLDTPAGRAEYKRRREKRWEMDQGICCLCGLPVSVGLCTLEHPDGRGMAGARRNDAVEAVRIAHLLGNAAKGGMRLEKYLEKPLEERIRLCRGW